MAKSTSYVPASCYITQLAAHPCRAQTKRMAAYSRSAAATLPPGLTTMSFSCRGKDLRPNVALCGKRLRDLTEEPIKYLYLDGVNFNMRHSDGISRVPVFVFTGGI